MTIVTSETPTYAFSNGEMVHDGYFIASNNHRLKWFTRWQWETERKRPAFYRLHLDHALSRARNAQPSL